MTKSSKKEQKNIMNTNNLISTLNSKRPVLIAGATASGKSALALQIATELGGVIVNADALQVYSGWRLLTARPSKQDEAKTPHFLYGHVNNKKPYSVGDWLRAIEPILASDQRPIIVGGTGLYFRALTEGLAPIPPIPKNIREQSAKMLANKQLDKMKAVLDEATLARIDLQNPMRVSRAWQVFQATGQSIVDWHAQTSNPLLSVHDCDALHLTSQSDWLNARLEQRFNMMLAAGVLDEVRENIDSWDPNFQSSQAIGALELMNYLHGHTSLTTAKELAIIASRQYAKRQRTWFRKRMTGWNSVGSQEL
jgi:tRNA dimethylallyltransferase